MNTLIRALRRFFLIDLPDAPAQAAPAPRPRDRRAANLAAAAQLTAGDGGFDHRHPTPPARPADERYRPPELPPGVRPQIDGDALITPFGERYTPTLAMDSGAQEMALDDGLGNSPIYTFLNANQFGGGYYFPGYPYLSELAQINEYRAPSETTATEMTRKWGKIVSRGAGDNADKIQAIEARFEELGVREKFQRAALWDGEFGRAQIIINIKGQTDLQTRQLPLLDTPESIPKGSLESLECIEPYWTTPYSWNSSYPERADFYKPQSWFVMGRKTHASRFLNFIAREVPDILKPSYNFGGISLSQLMQPTVDLWFRTRKSVNDLINAFSITILSTDMQSMLAEDPNAAGSLVNRAKLMANSRANLGVAMIDKENEDIIIQNTPLGSLDKLQAQAQEHMAAPAHIPLIKFFGVVPTGLNATGEGEIQVWYDWIRAMQENLFGPNILRLLKIVQLDLFGEIDKDLIWEWVSLDEPTAKELADIRASDATAAQGYIDRGVLSPEEERERLQNDPHSAYNNLNGPAPELEDVIPEGDDVAGNRRVENIDGDMSPDQRIS